jgi:homogentisate phytyltransferase/homogentisate geranylgeranyltransferase
MVGTGDVGTLPAHNHLMRALITLWKFTRPHTIIGSALSVSALYVLVLAQPGAVADHLGVWLPSLVAALACNVFITGLNQWSDVEVDRINKPWLPIPAGLLTRDQALAIVLASGALGLLLAAWSSPFFLGLIGVISFLGWAYSMPPIRFKRHHFGAALAITVVRGILVNLGFYAHFTQQLEGRLALDALVWPLTAFVALFSIGIAWFKDIPDTKGDAEYRFGTLAVRLGRRSALWMGVGVVVLAYLAVLLPAAGGALPRPVWYGAAYGLSLLLFVAMAFRLDVEDNVQVKRFYLMFWGLFFLAYLVYPVPYWLAR